MAQLIDNEKSAPDEPAPEPPRHDRHPELQLDLPSPVSLHHQELPAEPPRLAEVKRGSQFAPFQGRASITPFIDDDVAEEEPVTKPSDIVDRSGLSPTSPDRQSRALTAITASPRDSLTGDSQNPFDHPEHVVAAAASPNAVLDDPIPSPLNDPTLVPLAKEAGISILSEKLFKPSASVSSAGFATQKDHSDSESHNWSIIQSNEANSELSTTPTTSAFPQSLAYSNSPGLSPINSTDATSQPQPAQAPVTGAVAKANVYRVLIDFEPQMDDELPLRRGRLVRLLHSYDDGWALCCLLDNSAQGVAPRTCLAPIPFKPRSRPNPRNTGASKQHTSAPPSPLKETWTESVPIPVNPTASPAASHPTMPATLAPTKYEAWPLSAQEAPSATGAQPGANRSHPSLRETDVAPARPSPTYSTMPKVTTPQHLRPSSVSRTSLVSEAPEGARSSRVSTQSFVTANESSTDLTAAR
ncbi:hypothetical protein KEM52_005588 [Ascosphaera acerosa]|nr:hypothetical protein KEM52_005588 [Ascosphaera acerosa]